MAKRTALKFSVAKEEVILKTLLEDYLGVLCEVKTMKNELLFLGKLHKVRDDLSLTVDVVDPDGSALPKGAYDSMVKLSMFNKSSGLLALGGKVYIANDEFWRISNIVEHQHFERRGFFRVTSNSTCLVSVLQEEDDTNELPEAYTAKIMNISLSGVMFSSSHNFGTSKKLTLHSVVLGNDKLPFSLECIVRKSEEDRTEEDEFEGFTYGCSFLDLPAKELDRLCKVIFAMQREIIQKRRTRAK